MKTKLVNTQSFRGPDKTLMPETGELIEFDTDVNHGDWKTALVRKGSWPTITKGTKCEVVGWMQNLEGVHVRVKHGKDVYDIPRHRIVGLQNY